MTKKLFPNLAEKVKTEFWSLNQDKFSRIFFYLLILFLPTQFGKHFWPDFSYVNGIRLDYLSPTLYLTDLILLFLIVFSFKSTLKTIFKTKSNYLKIFISYVAFLLLGAIFAKNSLASFYGIIKFLEFSYLFAYIFLNIKKLNFEIIFNILFISLFFEFLLSFFQILNGGSLGGFLYFLGERTFTSQTPGIANASINGALFLRPYATFSHPNVLAYFFISAPLLMLNFYREKIYQKYLIYLSLIIATIGIFLTLGRSSIGIWIICIIFIFYYLSKDRFKKRIIPILIFLFLILLFTIIFYLQKNLYVERFLLLSFTDQSYTQRVWLINQSINIFEKSPFLGVGLNNFYYYLNPYFQDATSFFIQPVHNIYFLVLTETGLIGFLFFSYFLIGVFKDLLWKKFKAKKYLLTLFLASLFLGFFDHYLLTLQQGQLLFTLILGLCVSD
ncbi:MAG TPA: O-antigen ligase family protein [Candidatus Sulfotelmatobacter sp.]|nr:O-antigen ligase family protein [Candidatus Sulfotelmatobacter sp.]